MAYYGHIDMRQGFYRARAAAERALELDADLADAHVTLALGRLFGEWDWPAAGRELRQAIALDPKHALAHSVNALYLTTCGKFDESLSEARTARDLDPISVFTNIGVAWSHHFAGRYREALHEALRVRDLMPGMEEAGNVLIGAYEMLGRFEDAARLIGEQPCYGMRLDAAALLEAYQKGGSDEYWRTRLAQMTAANPSPAVHFGFAICHLKLGETDRALDHLEKMVEAHVGGVVFIGIDPTLRQLRGNQRYEAILKRVGSPMASAPRTASP